MGLRIDNREIPETYDVDYNGIPVYDIYVGAVGSEEKVWTKKPIAPEIRVYKSYNDVRVEIINMSTEAVTLNYYVGKTPFEAASAYETDRLSRGEPHTEILKKPDYPAGTTIYVQAYAEWNARQSATVSETTVMPDAQRAIIEQNIEITTDGTTYTSSINGVGTPAQSILDENIEIAMPEGVGRDDWVYGFMALFDARKMEYLYYGALKPCRMSSNAKIFNDSFGYLNNFALTTVGEKLTLPARAIKQMSGGKNLMLMLGLKYTKGAENPFLEIAEYSGVYTGYVTAERMDISRVLTSGAGLFGFLSTMDGTGNFTGAWGVGMVNQNELNVGTIDIGMSPTVYYDYANPETAPTFRLHITEIGKTAGIISFSVETADGRPVAYYFTEG